MHIKELPRNERPREKAMEYGVETLNNIELLAIILRSGTNGKSVLEVAQDLLQKADGISGLVSLRKEQLMEIKGIHRVKAMELSAIFELNRRCDFERLKDTDVIVNPEGLVHWLSKKIGNLEQEHFFVVFLDTKNQVKCYKELYIGGINSTIAHPREIFKEAYQVSCAKIIISHNHPSQVVEPSLEDISLTKEILEVGRIMKIPLIDHIIISRQGYYSFKEHHLI